MNAPFFVPNREISRLILDAVKEELITPYASDSLVTPLDAEAFKKRLQIPYPQEGDTLSDALEGLMPKKPGDPDEYFPNQLFLLEVKELFLFDERRSQMLNLPVAITLLIPAEYTPTGLDVVLASFSYQELSKKVLSDVNKAAWFNPENNAGVISMADALRQKFYSRRLVKYQNPANEKLIEMYDGKKGLVNSEKAVLQLMEFEAQKFRY